MKFTQHHDKSSHPIKSYLDGVVIVGETEYRQSLVIAPDSIVTDLLPAAVADLTGEHFTALIDSGADVILLGTGSTLSFPDQALMAQVLAQQVGLEVMDTAAACRTYNVLLSEGRNMIAALLLD
ncbi:MAG: Mth938-like domain-containing protein [Gammaproteobacteria bacterium]